jgi:transcriptional regulator with XRE-family HTH domain
MLSLSEGLIRARKLKGKTQKQVAVGSGMSERNYQDYEYGRVEPVASKLIALSDFLEVSIDYLCGKSDNPERR